MVFIHLLNRGMALRFKELYTSESMKDVSLLILGRIHLYILNSDSAKLISARIRDHVIFIEEDFSETNSPG